MSSANPFSSGSAIIVNLFLEGEEKGREGQRGEERGREVGKEGGRERGKREGENRAGTCLHKHRYTI